MEKIQELTDKLYREGVEKGHAEGQRIVEEAKAEARKLVADAQEEARGIVAGAHKEAEELSARTRSELKLYAGQALEALKGAVAEAVTGQLAHAEASRLAQDKDFMARLMLALAQNWSADGGLVVSASDADGLASYFASRAKSLLDKGVKIEKVNGKEARFSISPADGSYRVDFGEAEFEAYFKSFLRPKLVEMLF